MDDLVIGCILIGKILVNEKQERGEVVLKIKLDNGGSVVQKVKDGNTLVIV